MDTEMVAARRKLLALEVESKGLANVSRMAKKPDRQISDMVTGRKAFGDRVAREIGPLIRPDLPKDWLLSPSSDTQTESIGAKSAKPLAGAPMRTNVIPLHDSAKQGAGLLRFEKYPVTMSAGPGAYANHYDREAIDSFEVAEWWARQFIGSVDPERIKVVPSRGTSMSPTIPDGSLLFVDVTIRNHIGDGIYCIDLDGRLTVKRIHVRAKDRFFEVISDNPDGPPPDQYQLDDEDRICICGKVVAWLATHREN